MAQLRKRMKRKSIYYEFKTLYVSSGKMQGEERDFCIHLQTEIDGQNDFSLKLNEKEVKQIFSFFKQYTGI